jgi:diguanylate cyclase (GGDEF)-like protein/PAS domain S-box-containing protein
MKNWWQSQCIGIKLNVPIQLILVVLLSIAHYSVMQHISDVILEGARQRAAVSADGVINGMNMLMLSGVITDPDDRRLFIKKMAASNEVLALRIMRTKQVQDQFGQGLPEEQIHDDMDRRVIQSKRAEFRVSMEGDKPTLRAVVPFIASHNFRGTDCLTCHHVAAGSVNGAASITLDLSEDYNTIARTRKSLWLGQIGLQIVLLLLIIRVIRIFIEPVMKLQSAMESTHLLGSMASFVPIQLKSGAQDEFGRLSATFNQMSQALCESEQSMRLASSIYQFNADAIVVTDENNLIVDVNPAFTRISGYTRDEVIGKNPNIMQSGQHDATFYQEMWHSILNTDHWQGEIWDKKSNGELYAKEANIIALRHKDGKIYRYVAQFSDITEKKYKDELIFRQANYDTLTNLPNRRLFMDRLELAIKQTRRDTRYLAIFFIDLDYFKEINDTLGHANGDTLLIEAALRISSCVRESDTVARLGGDEFTVILPELNDTLQPGRIALSIIEKLAKPFYFANIEKGHCISASIGIALFPSDADDLANLLKCADKAMYAAKSAGRNRFVFFSRHARISY